MTIAITPAGITAARQLRSHPVSIEVVQETGSTNADLLRCTASLDQPALLLALSQTAGRGRNGRAWHSAPGSSLTFSLAWKFQLAAHELVGLPLAVGVALAQALGKLGVQVQLKWPNDVLKNGKKLAGVLIETAKKSRGEAGIWVVIGVGMNLALPVDLEEKIDQPAADAPWLAQLDKNILVAGLLDELTDALTRFAQDRLPPFVQAWNKLDALAGQEVIVTDREQIMKHGISAGIDDSGQLMLDSEVGRIAISAGDVSLRATGNSITDDLASKAFVARRRAADNTEARQVEVENEISVKANAEEFGFKRSGRNYKATDGLEVR